MENDQLRSRVTETFRNVFGDSALVISDGMTAEDVEQWDSLTHINLIVALEREFRVKFTTGEVSKLKNVGDLISLIQRKTS
jgi:acyl carrier protein